MTGPLAFVLDLAPGRWGWFDGPLPDGPSATVHAARTPLPPSPGPPGLTWHRGDEAGAARSAPDVCSHDRLRDLVCSPLAAQVLLAVAAADVHVVGRATWSGEERTVLRVVTVLDVADKERSLPEGTTDHIDFPEIGPDGARTARGRLFRLPDPGMALTVLAGQDVYEAVVAAGLTGVRFDPARVELEGLSWTAEPGPRPVEDLDEDGVWDRFGALLDVPWERLGFSARALVALGALRAEVNNGGFDQYFFNSTGDRARESVGLLRGVGLPELADLLDRALDVLGATGELDRDARSDLLETLDDGAFDALDEEFYALEGDRLDDAMRRLAGLVGDAPG